MAECTQEVMFTTQLLRELTGVTNAGIVYGDNVGSLFLVENKQVGQRTKHIDVRYHFIRQKKEEGMLHTLFRRSEDNRSDVMTKNVTVNLFQNHLPSIRSIKEDQWREDVATYQKDILEIGQRGHHHGLGPCKTRDIPTENGSSDKKDHAITHESQKAYRETDIESTNYISGECETESTSEGEERNDRAVKEEIVESAHNTQGLWSNTAEVDQEIRKDLQGREDNLPER